ncbi:MAG: type II toxin-antitoxin system RelE/ParE family toxin [Nitrospirae bacterium]|nr:type II toxin-antitoxin system RelE/ParE family toxin [Nitrospirota bacterium]
MKSAGSFIIREYLAASGGSPFRDWLNRLDVSVKARVQARILRFESGNLGDCKSIGAGVREARLDFGPGYRVYFGMEGRNLVLLLMGGTKRTQSRDIEQARKFWLDYLERGSHGTSRKRLE